MWCHGRLANRATPVLRAHSAFASRDTSYGWVIDKVKKPGTGAVFTIDLKGRNAHQVSLTLVDNSGGSNTITTTVQP